MDKLQFLKDTISLGSECGCDAIRCQLQKRKKAAEGSPTTTRAVDSMWTVLLVWRYLNETTTDSNQSYEYKQTKQMNVRRSLSLVLVSTEATVSFSMMKARHVLPSRTVLSLPFNVQQDTDNREECSMTKEQQHGPNMIMILSAYRVRYCLMLVCM